MSKGFRFILMVVHASVSVILGALLLAMPGRFLGWLGWAPVDPIISRILGAALLAFAWGDLRAWRRLGDGESRAWMEVQLAFAALSAIGVLRHLAVAHYPVMVWILFGGLVAFGAGWLLALLTARVSSPAKGG